MRSTDSSNWARIFSFVMWRASALIPLMLPMLAVAEPPDAAADEGEKDKADGEGAGELYFARA